MTTEHDSAIVEMSLVITKASYDKTEVDPNKKRRIQMVNSDTSPDLYQESMSVDLYKDFSERIKNDTPIPDVFKSSICEDGVWCGGMPYLSVAHYRAGRDGKNVPGTVESVYVDSNQLKSRAYLHDTPLGQKLFETLHEEVEKHKLGTLKEPVRVSIGFLDLEHVHEVNGKSFVFERKSLGQKCSLCEKGEGGKIYRKGHLVHLAATRVPVNPRTQMGLEEKSIMGEITTKREDAASIIGDELAKDLEEKSAVSDVLVVKADTPEQDDLKAELITVKSTLDEVLKSLEKLQGTQTPVVEESMDEKVIEKAEEPKVEIQTEVKEVSALDAQFASLKSLLATNPTTEKVQEAFNSFGAEVQKAYTPPAPSKDDIAEIVKSAVEAAVAPLKMQVAQLQAGQTVVAQKSLVNPISRALTITPAELTQRSVQPERQLSQIEMIARRSTGASA